MWSGIVPFEWSNSVVWSPGQPWSLLHEMGLRGWLHHAHFDPPISAWNPWPNQWQWQPRTATNIASSQQVHVQLGPISIHPKRLQKPQSSAIDSTSRFEPGEKFQRSQNGSTFGSHLESTQRGFGQIPLESDDERMRQAKRRLRSELYFAGIITNTLHVSNDTLCQLLHSVKK